MSDATRGQRLNLRLDPEMLVEGLILERLATVPKHRRQDWLRSLLVAGFLRESGILGKVRAQTPDRNRASAERGKPGMPRSAFSGWLGRTARPAPVPPSPPADSATMTPMPASRAGSGKPFAHLRKVIG